MTTDPDARDSTDRLTEMLYNELRKLAAHELSHERTNHTLSPTALVHSAYMRLADLDEIDWQNRAHFMGLAARTIRRVLVDHARTKKRDKRGGGVLPVAFDGLAIDGHEEADLLELNEWLERLGVQSERAAKVVELKAFGGLRVPEIAQALGHSERTVKGDLAFARAWFNRERERSKGPNTPESDEEKP